MAAGFHSSGYLRYETFFPCCLRNSTVIGVCKKRCERSEEGCSYCPRWNVEVCRGHNVQYCNNNYLRGNGVCCECLYEFRMKYGEGEVYVAVRR